SISILLIKRTRASHALVLLSFSVLSAWFWQLTCPSRLCCRSQIFSWVLNLPLGLKIKFLFEISFQLFNLYSFLFHSITVSYGNCPIIFRVKVIGDADRSTDFVLAAITFSNVSSVVIFTVIFLGKLLINFLRSLCQLFRKWKHTYFHWRQSRVEMKNCPDVILFCVQNLFIISAAKESQNHTVSSQ